MSFQAGVRYFDSREVAPEEAAAVRACVWDDDRQESKAYQEAGLLLAHSAVQPHSTMAGAITFDGRIDNRADLLRRLGNVPGPDSGDASLVVPLYEKAGVDGLTDLIGDWSLAIWDRRRRVLLLASDYAGIRPLYYCVKPGRVYWSTRLRPLVNLVQAYEIDETYVAGVLAFTGIPNYTPYRGIYSVPPGCALEFDGKAEKTVRFWRLPVQDRIRYREESEYEEHLRALFREAVECRIPAGSRCVSELSGGLDSSSVVAMAADLMRTGNIQPESFTTLTVEHEDSRDTPFYTAMERQCGFKSIHLAAAEHPFVTAAETGGVLPGFWAALQKHTAQMARQIGATTYLTGRLGDDVMGNWWDDSEQVAGLLRDGHFRAAVEETFAWSKSMRIPAAWIFLRALGSSLPAGLGLAPRNRLSGAPETAREREDSLAAGLRERTGVSDKMFSRDWMRARPERRRHCHTLTQTFQLRRLQAPEPLQHLDYTHPFAHRPLVSFLLAVPADVLCRAGQPRRLMRRAFQPLWPPNLQKRRSKDGFGTVFLDSLRPLADEMREPGRHLEVVERGYVDAASLKRRLDRLALSLTCNEPQLRQIILLEFWLRDLEGRTGTVRAGTMLTPAS